MKAYLEYREGKSAKFWEVVVEGSSYTVRFGRIGTNGQSKTKTLESAEAARTDARASAPASGRARR